MPIDPELGVRDPNFRLLRVLKDAGQAELDRQARERPRSRVCPPEAVDLRDLVEFPSAGAKTT